MSSNQSLWRMLAAVLLLTGLALVAQAALPRGWLLAGTNLSGYEVGVDVDADGFGTLMQSIKANQYLGRKVRLGGLVKSEEVLGWAGLWMRVDKEKSPVAFDNMENRAIKGTTGWQPLRRSAGRTKRCDRHIVWNFVGRFRSSLA
jgi:hypothetical protein